MKDLENIETMRRITGRKVLIVEQNDRQFYSIEKQLSHKGIKIFRVDTEKEMLRMAVKGIDLMITNTEMFNKFSSSVKESLNIPVIFYS